MIFEVLLYLEVDVKAHGVVPDLEHSVPCRDQVATVVRHHQAAAPTAVNFCHLQHGQNVTAFKILSKLLLWGSA